MSEAFSGTEARRALGNLDIKFYVWREGEWVAVPKDKPHRGQGMSDRKETAMDRETYQRVAAVARNVKLSPGDQKDTPSASARWALRWRQALIELGMYRGKP